MATPVETRYAQLYQKLQSLYLDFQSALSPHFDASMLCDQGVDAIEVDLVKTTSEGGVYFQPMSLERLNSLDKRPTMYEIPFWPQKNPTLADAYMVQDAINDQLGHSKDDDLWRAYDRTEWEPVGTSCRFEKRLEERACNPQGPNPTRRTSWRLLDVFATKDSLPHRTCMSCHQNLGEINGLIRSELMILTGLMMVGMYRAAQSEHEVIPVLMLALYGSKGRLIEAYMCLTTLRLQAWLDTLVRWFLSKPLAEPAPQSKMNELDLYEEDSDVTDDFVLGTSETDESSDSDMSLNPDTTAPHPPQKPSPLGNWSPGCNL